MINLVIEHWEEIAKKHKNQHDSVFDHSEGRIHLMRYSTENVKKIYSVRFHVALDLYDLHCRMNCSGAYLKHFLGSRIVLVIENVMRVAERSA